ncbi:unnamed protein product, partial [Effrenium voratum]
ELQSNPPPKSELRLDRWLERKLLHQSAPRQGYASLDPFALQVLFQAPDLLLAPIAVSPMLAKRELRELHLRCQEDTSCFKQNLTKTAEMQLPKRDPQHNLLLLDCAWQQLSPLWCDWPAVIGVLTHVLKEL